MSAAEAPGSPARRGTLRVYLGAAPGVGKTYAMLAEAHRRAERGTDVVVALAEHHHRPRTAALLDGLEQVARQGAEVDTAAVLRRRPAVACVDELAHTNGPGGRHAKRWQDVAELLDAGIDVISTVNVWHLESLRELVESVTGVRQADTVPDEVVRGADQVELVDMAPEALRRRLAHGDICPPEKVDAALSRTFRLDNLTALRELALLWTADRVDAYRRPPRQARDAGAAWRARERIVVALTGGPEGATLIRRAAELATRGPGAELLAVHVTRADGLTAASSRALAAQRALVEELGGSFHQVLGHDIPNALLDFARAHHASQIVLGTSRRKSWQYVFGPGVGAIVARDSGPDLDAHIVTHEEAAKGRGLPVSRGARLGRSRQLAGWLVGLGGPALLTAVLARPASAGAFASDVLLFLAVTVAAALVGGRYPGLASAGVGAGLLVFSFTAPAERWTIADTHNVVAVVVFFAIAVAVAAVVDRSARRTQQAARLRAESETLTLLAGSVLRGEDALAALLERARETFGMESAALLERDSAEGRWSCVGSVCPVKGGSIPSRPEDADADMPVGEDAILALSGRVLPAEDRRVLGAFAAQAAAILDRRRLLAEAERAHKLAEGNRIRTALLAAVSHDLRTPLAAIKASVSSLRSPDVAWSAQDEADLLESIEQGADRLEALVGNLLDMSRLQTGTVEPLIRALDLDEVVPRALGGVPEGSVLLDVPEALPFVAADPGLLERSVANIVENGVKYSPSGVPVLVRGSTLGDRVELRVVDRGPGVPDSEKERIFEPFQRHGDTPRGNGVGLGLAVARGFAEALGGTLEAEDTPGGGMTMVLTLRTAAPVERAEPGDGELPSGYPAYWAVGQVERADAPYRAAPADATEAPGAAAPAHAAAERAPEWTTG